MRVVGLFGVPGTGKSTLMRAIMAELGGPPPYRIFSQGTARGHLFSRGPTLVFGIYARDDIYGGTDKLSMSCQRDVLTCINKWSQKWPLGNILFEGDRLSNRSFLQACEKGGHTLYPFYLQARQATREARFAERGSQQASAFLAGRETKVRNLAAEFRGPTLISESRPDIQRNADCILREALDIKTHKGA